MANESFGYEVKLDDKVSNIINELSKKFDTLDDRLGKIETSSNKTTSNIKSGFNGLIGQALSFTASLISVEKGIELFAKGFSEAKSDISSIFALQQKFGENTNLLKLADDLAKEFSFLEDSSNRLAFVNAATFNLTEDGIKKVLPTLIDMVGYNKLLNNESYNLNSAIDELQKSFIGNDRSLKAYGVTLSESQKHSLEFGNENERLSVIIDTVGKKVSGFSDKFESQKTVKSIEEIKKAFDEFLESVGKLSITLSESGDLASGLKEITNLFDSLNKTVSDFNAGNLIDSMLKIERIVFSVLGEEKSFDKLVNFINKISGKELSEKANLYIPHSYSGYSGSPTGKALNKDTSGIEEAKKKAEELKKLNEEMLNALSLNSYSELWDSELNNMVDSAKKMIDEVNDYNEFKYAESITLYQELNRKQLAIDNENFRIKSDLDKRKLVESVENWQKIGSTVSNIMNNVTSQFSNAMSDAIIDGKANWNEMWKSALRGALSMIIELTLMLTIVKAIKVAMGSAFGGPVGFIGGLLSHGGRYLTRGHSGLMFNEIPIIGLRGESLLNRRATRELGGEKAVNQINSGTYTNDKTLSIGSLTVISQNSDSKLIANDVINSIMNLSLSGKKIISRKGIIND